MLVVICNNGVRGFGECGLKIEIVFYFCEVRECLFKMCKWKLFIKKIKLN